MAFYEHEPFAHIITAEKVLSDIGATLQRAGGTPRVLRIATPEDLKELSKVPGNFVQMSPTM